MIVEARAQALAAAQAAQEQFGYHPNVDGLPPLPVMTGDQGSMGVHPPVGPDSYYSYPLPSTTGVPMGNPDGVTIDQGMSHPNGYQYGYMTPEGFQAMAMPPQSSSSNAAPNIFGNVPGYLPPNQSAYNVYNLPPGSYDAPPYPLQPGENMNTWSDMNGNMNEVMSGHPYPQQVPGTNEEGLTIDASAITIINNE